METATVCVINIGPRERRRRLAAGAVAFGISLATAVLLVVGGYSVMWRLPLVLPLWAAALGFFQARDKT